MSRCVAAIVAVWIVLGSVTAADPCEWAGEFFSPGDTIRPDLWCVLTCEPSGDWRVDCD